MFGEDGKWHFHVFVAFERSTEVKVLDIDAHEFCFGGAEYTIPNDFTCGQVGRSCSEFTWVVYEVSAGGDSYAIRVLFLWAIVDNNSSVCYGTIARNFGHVLWFHNDERIGSRCVSFVISLCEATKFFSECRFPSFFQQGVGDEFVIFRDVFSCHWVYNGGTHVGNVLVWG